MSDWAWIVVTVICNAGVYACVRTYVKHRYEDEK